MISRCYIIAVAAHLMAWAACIRSNINGLWSKEARGEPPGGLCDRAWKALPNTHTVFNNVFSRLSFIFSTLSNTFNYSKKAKSCDIKELAPSLKKFLGKTKNDFFEFSSLKKAEVDENGTLTIYGTLLLSISIIALLSKNEKRLLQKGKDDENCQLLKVLIPTIKLFNTQTISKNFQKKKLIHLLDMLSSFMVSCSHIRSLRNYCSESSFNVCVSASCREKRGRVLTVVAPRRKRP